MGNIGFLWGKTYTKEDYRKNKVSGFFQYRDPKTGRIREEGRFENGNEVGLWKQYDSDGDEMHCEYSQSRVGAICKDGSRTKATGRGAGSHHGGVKQWVFNTSMKKVGGTGKYKIGRAHV